MKVLLITSEFGEKGGGLSLVCKRFYELLVNDLLLDVDVISSNYDTARVSSGGYWPELESYIGHEYGIKDLVIKYNGLNPVIIGFGGSFNGYFAAILAQKLKGRFILMLRGTDANLAKWDLKNAEFLNRSAIQAESIVCLSEEIKDNLSIINPQASSKSYVVPNIMHFGEIDVKCDFSSRKLVFGTSAYNINEKKGITNLLVVIGRLKKILSHEISFNIVGNIDSDLLSCYADLCQQNNISENVNFIGQRSREEFIELLKDWDFYLQGSVCEGFGNAVSESITNNKPVILSNTGYIAEQFRKTLPQVILESWESAYIAERISEVLRHPDVEKYYTQAYKALALKTSKEAVLPIIRDIVQGNRVRCITSSKHLPLNTLSVVFHDIVGTEHDHITTPVSVFEDFVNMIHRNSFQLRSLKDYLGLDEDSKGRTVVCTFDDGYASLLHTVAPILKRYGDTATVFINSSLIGKTNDWNWKDGEKRNHLKHEEIVSLVNLGWEIGSHGHTHRNVLRLSGEELQEEFAQSYKVLERYNSPVISYAYPYGEYSDYSKKLCGNTFKYAFALSKGGTCLDVDHHQLKRYPVDQIIKLLDLQ